MAAPVFKSDIPSEQWLREKLHWTEQDGRNQWGVPKTFGPMTGTFDRPLHLPVQLLIGVPGERAEQRNVRPDSLAYIRENFDRVVQDPVYIEVDPYGKAWMSEGNHRIMVAAERGVTHLQAQVRYFSGGEREATDFASERLMAMDAEFALQIERGAQNMADDRSGTTRPDPGTRPGAVLADHRITQQFRDLIFTMQDGWGHVHASGDEQLKSRWSSLMRSYGDVAEVPAVPSREGNRELFAALSDGRRHVLVPFASNTLRSRYTRVLEQHAELAEQLTPDPRICRLAFVNEWSDALVAHAQQHLKGTPDEVLTGLQRAADDLNLSGLRGGDEALAQRAAATLGFASAEDLRHFRRENPMLSAALKAEPVLENGSGRVIGLSSTEVALATEQGPVFFERSWLKADAGVGDAIRVRKFGEADVAAAAVASVYEPEKKHTGSIPEIKYLPVSAIHRQEMDFRPEVMTVSDEVAANMDFSQAVQVTAFRYGTYNADCLPEVTLRDGHHRTAAALQTGRRYLPVEVTAINAKGEKLNALIVMSRAIEERLEAQPDLQT